MTDQEITRLHKKYAPNEEAFNLVYEHCVIIAKIARECGEKYEGSVDVEGAVLAAMLHDIGAYTLFIPELHTFKQDGYQQHALIGATILEEEGLPKNIVDAVRTHVLMGITAEDIKLNKWKLPYKDFLPQTIEAELLCYADRFHSKDPQFNHHESYYKKLEQNSPDQSMKFKKAIQKFGLPDIDQLRQEHAYPLR